MPSNHHIAVPLGTTDEQLEKILTSVLPQILVRKYKMSEQDARKNAPLLASQIVSYKRGCEGHLNAYPREKIQLLGPRPTVEECEEIKRLVDEIVVVRYGQPGKFRKHPVELFVGRVWADIMEKWGTDRDWEREKKTPASAVGVRG